MAKIATSLRKLRSKTEPDWLQRGSEKADAAWQLWGEGANEKAMAEQYAKDHPPQPEPVPEMPDPEEIQRRQRKATASRRSRGRASTIFTPPGEGLGG